MKMTYKTKTKDNINHINAIRNDRYFRNNKRAEPVCEEKAYGSSSLT